MTYKPTDLVNPQDDSGTAKSAMDVPEVAAAREIAELRRHAEGKFKDHQQFAKKFSVLANQHAEASALWERILEATSGINALEEEE